MARFRQPRKPSFLWQALLILFPVGVLAAVGFLSLRRDKILAQHEAVERAQIIADELLPRLWSALTNADKEAFEHHAFQIDSGGELLFPPPVLLTPSPEPLNPTELTAEQASLWAEATRAEASEQNIPAAIHAVRKFLETKPPDRFVAVANYNLAVLLAKQQQPQAAADSLLSLLNNYPHAVAPSGLSLNRLAEFKLLELSTLLTNHPPEKTLISPEYFCSTIISEPSPLTASFLAWVSENASAVGAGDSIEKWTRLWQQDEESRQLYKSARSNLMLDASVRSASQRQPGAEVLWFNDASENCLAIRFDEIPDSKESISGNAFSSGNAKFYTGQPLKTHESVARLPGKMDLRPLTGKNNLKSLEFSGPASESGNSGLNERRQVSHNEPTGLSPSRSSKSFYGGGVPQRNIMSPEFSGPAAIQPGSATNPWYLCRTEAEISQALFPLIRVAGQVPDYFGIGIDVAGKRLRDAAPDLRNWREVGFFERGGNKGRKIYLPTTATNVLATAFS